MRARPVLLPLASGTAPEELGRGVRQRRTSLRTDTEAKQAISHVSDQDEFRINWINVVGSAAGAVSGAVLLSTLGAAGTLLGAALSSACITVGGAFYAHSMRLTTRRLATAHRVPVQDQVQVRDSTRTPVGSRRVKTSDAAQQPAAPRQPWRQTLRELPWKRIGVATAGLFVLAMAVILTFELSTGRPVSSYTGGSSDTRTGTSVPGVRGSGSKSDGADTPSPASSEQGPTSRPSSPEQPGTSPAPEQPSSAPSDQVPSPPVPSLPPPTP